MEKFKLINILIVKLLAIMVLSSSLQAAQVYDYWFDACHWDGTTGEVLDHSGNNNNASKVGDVQTSSEHVIQRSAYFDGTDDYIQLSSDLTTLTGATASLSFWIKTTDTGNNVAWSSPGVTGVENKGTTDDIFWGWLDSSGHIGITVGNGPDVKSADPVNDDIWHHIVLTRNAADGSANVYVDGTLSSSGTLSTDALNATFSSIGRIEDTGGSPEALKGYLDEVEIYDHILSASEVASIYKNESRGNNWDGTIRPAGNCTQAYDDTVSTPVNTPITIIVMGNDTGSNLTLQGNTNPTHGSVAVAANGVDYTYTPDTDYVGTDSFTYTISGSDTLTSTATVYITVLNIDSNLVAEYRLDECGYDGKDPYDVVDNSINRLNGRTINHIGLIHKSDKDDKVCTGAVFDGPNAALDDGDYIEVQDNAKLNMTDFITISFWVNSTYSGDHQYFINKELSGGNNGWHVSYNNNNQKIVFRIYINGISRRVSFAPSNWFSSWHMVTATYDGSVMILYIDGSLVKSNNKSGTIDAPSNAKLLIGRSNSGDYLKGTIDEVKIWNRALSSQEISDIYTNENAGRNWNEDDTYPARVCNKCECEAKPGSNMVSFQSDFRNMAAGTKDLETMLSPDFGTNYGDTGDWYMARRDYDIVTDNKNYAYYTALPYTGYDLEFGKGYWIKNALDTNVTYSCNLTSMDFNATITDYPSCQSANGKCVLVDLVSPNGTNNNGPYIYTLTSFPVSKKIRWDSVQLLIDGQAYPIDSTPARTLNSTIWRYDQDGKNYTNVTPGTPGVDKEIDPCYGYWVELDAYTAGKNVQLLIPQE